MNTMELNVAMLRKGVNVNQMADVIKKSRVSFNRKKYGEVPFDANEILALSEALSLTQEQVNVIFLTVTCTTVIKILWPQYKYIRQKGRWTWNLAVAGS